MQSPRVSQADVCMPVCDAEKGHECVVHADGYIPECGTKANTPKADACQCVAWATVSEIVVQESTCPHAIPSGYISVQAARYLSLPFAVPDEHMLLGERNQHNVNQVMMEEVKYVPVCSAIMACW